MSTIKAVVLSGSGSLYPCHLGFLQAILDDNNNAFVDPKKITCVAGVSGGSFTAMLFLVCSALPNASEAFKEACDDFLRYGIDDLITKLDLSLLLTKFGVVSTEPFECHFIDILRIHAKCDGKQGRLSPFMTFQELFVHTNKTFVVVASDPVTNTPKYFSHLETPDVKVLSAVRFSITVTGLFAMEKNDKNDQWHQSKYSPGEWRWVDGSFTDTYPLQYVADLLQLPSKNSLELLGNFIGDSTTLQQDNYGMKTFLASQAAWLLSSRIQPDPINSVIVPLHKGESVFSRLGQEERHDLLIRSKEYTTAWFHKDSISGSIE